MGCFIPLAQQQFELVEHLLPVQRANVAIDI